MFSFARTATSPAAGPGRTPLPGLDPESTYHVRVRDEASSPAGRGASRGSAPDWAGPAGVRLSGRVLGHAGLALPILQPGEVVVLQLTAAPSDP